MGRTGSWQGGALAIAALVVATGVAVGCGADDNESAAGGSSTEETAPGNGAKSIIEPPGAYVRNFTDLVVSARDKKDCAELKRISTDSIVQFKCPAKSDIRSSLSKFNLVDDARYGTGAVVDYTSGDVPEGASVILNISPEGDWKISRYGIVSGPTVGTSDAKTRAGFEQAVAGYLKAVESRDCDAYDDYTVNTGPDRKVVCKFDFPQTAELAKAVRANPTVKPKYLGGNSVFGFFGFTTRKPQPAYVTISVIKTGKGATQPFQVLNSLPGPLPQGSGVRGLEDETVVG